MAPVAPVGPTAIVYVTVKIGCGHLILGSPAKQPLDTHKLKGDHFKLKF
ncbi:hypothetical protein SBF1_5390003 [Candidatus Desulfosporosinus infrequens]|uniref:Uncharacterized protein n=1 Tax=Candidatus Desulfosporosinus infrequens TaxID=2043169 RepID=A0A2U3LJ62_9FIRM|nr:hypothetical protein SBF1_5390003 [Candidatus Desulfosporosinus infrequens]